MIRWLFSHCQTEGTLLHPANNQSCFHSFKPVHWRVIRQSTLLHVLTQFIFKKSDRLGPRKSAQGFMVWKDPNFGRPSWITPPGLCTYHFKNSSGVTFCQDFITPGNPSATTKCNSTFKLSIYFPIPSIWLPNFFKTFFNQLNFLKIKARKM